MTDRDEIKKHALMAYFVGNGGPITVADLARVAMVDVEFVQSFLDDLVTAGKATKDGDTYVQTQPV